MCCEYFTSCAAPLGSRPLSAPRLLGRGVGPGLHGVLALRRPLATGFLGLLAVSAQAHLAACKHCRHYLGLRNHFFAFLWIFKNMLENVETLLAPFLVWENAIITTLGCILLGISVLHTYRYTYK